MLFVRVAAVYFFFERFGHLFYLLYLVGGCKFDIATEVLFPFEKDNRECAAGSRFAFQNDFCGVFVCQILYKGQADAGTRLGRVFVERIEADKQFFLFLMYNFLS